MKSRNNFVLLFSIVLCLDLHATGKIKLSLQQADSMFLANNFSLLASSMNIEAQKAQILQAKLYPNPTIGTDFNVYDPDNKQIFHIGSSGEKDFQFNQLILMGGKRKTEIEMAKTNATIAELEFQQLIRQLRYKLHSDLFSVGLQQFLLEKYNKQLALIDTLLSSYQVQADKGNVPLKDLVRLKAEYLQLNDNRAEIFKQYCETQSDLQTLLQTPFNIEFEFTESEISDYIRLHDYEELKSEAMKNRPDLNIMQQNQLLAQQYLQLQKRMNIPDVNLLLSYDQRGNAFQNQVNGGISLPIPIWDRNKGNIKTAEFKKKQTEYDLAELKAEIMADLQNSYTFYSQTVTEYKKLMKLYNQDFETTVNGMTDNFQKRNISIVEFVDFFEAYNEVLTELTRIKTQLVLSGEQLNLLVGKDIY